MSWSLTRLQNNIGALARRVQRLNRPTLNEEGCELRQGRWEDHLPSIPSGSVELVYTDPPYGQAHAIRIEELPELMNNGPGDIDWYRFLRESYRVLKTDTWFVMHCSQDLLRRMGAPIEASRFNYKGTIIWRKGRSIFGDVAGSLRRDWEPIAYLAKGRPTPRPIAVPRRGRMVMRSRISESEDWFFTLPNNERVGHPTQKPVALCQQVIKVFSDPGAVVLDPFAGSGSIPLAAARVGRKSIAIEADPTYFHLMEGRLASVGVGVIPCSSK